MENIKTNVLGYFEKSLKQKDDRFIDIKKSLEL